MTSLLRYDTASTKTDPITATMLAQQMRIDGARKQAGQVRTNQTAALLTPLAGYGGSSTFHLTTGSSHGDLNPENIVVADHSSVTVTLLDQDSVRADSLPRLTYGRASTSEDHKTDKQLEIRLISGTDMAGQQLQKPANELAAELKYLLQNEEIEDGVTHPAEAILDNALGEYPDNATAWIREIFKRFERTSPSLAAGILRCLGRLSELTTDDWARELAIRALHHPNVQIRDAAVAALESWLGKESYKALQSRLDTETVPWLKQYIRRVIESWPEKQEAYELHCAEDHTQQVAGSRDY